MTSRTHNLREETIKFSGIFAGMTYQSDWGLLALCCRTPSCRIDKLCSYGAKNDTNEDGRDCIIDKLGFWNADKASKKASGRLTSLSQVPYLLDLHGEEAIRSDEGPCGKIVSQRTFTQWKSTTTKASPYPRL